MFVIISIFVIILNIIFIVIAARNDSKYGVGKLILALGFITLWIICMVVVYFGISGKNTLWYVSSSHIFEAFVAPVSAVALYEFAYMKKIKKSTLLLIFVIPICVVIFGAVPQLNHFLIAHVANDPTNEISDFTYTKPFLLYEAYSYVSGVVCLILFYKIEKKPYATSGKRFYFVCLTILGGTLVNILTVHGILITKANYAPIVYSISYFMLFYLLGMFTFYQYKNFITENIIDKVGNIILVYDERGTVIFANKTFEKTFKTGGVLGENIFDEKVFKTILPENFYNQIINREDKSLIKIKNRHFKLNFQEIKPYSKSTLKILNFIDITEEIDHNDMIIRLSNTDGLSYLGNRQAFEKDVVWINDGKYENLTVIVIDVDNLKAINDILGHFAGDVLLKTLAEFLNEIFTENTLGMYRIGGDEFCVITQIFTIQEIKEKTDKLFAMADEFNLSNDMQLLFSAGCATNESVDADVMTLFKYADVSMYKSKEQGKNQVTFFSQEINDEIVLNDQLKNDFVYGLNHGEFTAFIQPKFNVEKGVVDSGEALVRWIHRDLGLIAPYKFLDLASSLRLVSELDFIVFEESCKALQKWKIKYDKIIYISVNLSLESLAKPALFYDVERVIKKYEINPGCITFEILENKMINDFDGVKKIIKKFSLLGIKFAIDDFGSGFSNFNTANSLNADFIKLDKSLIDNVAIDVDSAENVNLICKLIKNLGSKIVAEGVETAEQVEVLKKFKVEYLQGYYYDKAISLENFEAKYLA